MKFVIFLAVVALAASRPDNSTYDSRFDNFNVDDIISSTRFLRGYLKCFLDEGKCSPDGKIFKKWIPEAVQTTCGKCTEKQKVLIAKVLKAMNENLSDEYNRLYAKHDPENKRRQELEEFIEKYSQSSK